MPPIVAARTAGTCQSCPGAQQKTLYLIALSKVGGVGDARVKKLVAYCGGPKEVFDKPKSFLSKIPTIGNAIANAVHSSNVLGVAEAELEFASKNNVKAISFLDEDYPQRLKHCHDSPIVLYAKGNGSAGTPRARGPGPAADPDPGTRARRWTRARRGPGPGGDPGLAGEGY